MKSLDFYRVVQYYVCLYNKVNNSKDHTSIYYTFGGYKYMKPTPIVVSFKL